MTSTKSFLLLSLVLTGVFQIQAAEAQDTEVYKTVGENGEVTFSDADTPGAEAIEVQPNVVDEDVPVMPASNIPVQQEMQPGIQPENSIEVQQNVYGRGTADAENLRRRVQVETNGEGIARPDGVVTPYGEVESPRREITEPHDRTVNTPGGVGGRR